MEDREFIEVQDVEVSENQIPDNVKIGHNYALYALIASIVGLVSGFGIIGGVLGLVLGNTAKKFGEESDMLTASKIISIIGIVLGTLALLAVFLWFIFVVVIGVASGGI